MKNIIKTSLTCLLLLPLFLVCCKGDGTTRVTATGSIYELLIVVDNDLWKGEIGDTLKHYLGHDMPCLPQMEPVFSVSQVAPRYFDDLLKPVRNVLVCDVNPEKYTKSRLLFYKDYYSRPQALARIQAPSADSLMFVLTHYGKRIEDYFVKQELERQGKFLRSYTNREARQALQQTQGYDIFVPSDYLRLQSDTSFFWCAADNGGIRRDLIVYSYPFVSNDAFTEKALLNKRDSVMHERIHGGIDGSYMTTEYRIFPPQYTEKLVDSAYCAEIRGLWRMEDGESMGGPFVQLNRLDTKRQRVVTTEVYIYASGKKKRNPLRQAEAILYTLDFR